jgi:large subunit ribosomal protein L6
MSRIGKSPVVFDKTVQVSVGANNVLTVKGAKAQQAIKLNPKLSAKVEGNQVVLSRTAEDKQTRGFHGLFRMLVQNAVIGVTKGWTRELELNGVGYRANLAGKVLELNLGFSHQIKFPVPEGVEIKVDKQTKIIVTGANRELVGQVAAKIRGFRPPEPYLGKGIKYVDEKIRRKAGKSGAAK